MIIITGDPAGRSQVISLAHNYAGLLAISLTTILSQNPVDIHCAFSNIF